ncbi:hypothetical protein ACWGQ2_08610 [Arthrobacter sp. NPDC055585]
MTGYPIPNNPSRRRPYFFGMPLLLMAGLALLGLPRVVLHDLHLIGERSPVTWFLALFPVAVWITVTVLVRSPRPFLTVLVIGLMFGVLLVITHQLLWDAAFSGNAPEVGSGPVAEMIPRIAAVPGGLMTGAAIGAVGGLFALAGTALRGQRSMSARTLRR